MAKNKTTNHKADIHNANKGTNGVNKIYAKAQGNRGKLMNPTYYKNHPQHQPKSFNKSRNK